jgi:hypothetical protein
VCLFNPPHPTPLIGTQVGLQPTISRRNEQSEDAQPAMRNQALSGWTSILGLHFRLAG